MSPLIVLSGLPVGFEWISFFCLYSIENICSFFWFREYMFLKTSYICVVLKYFFFLIHSLLLCYIYVSINHDNTYTHLTNNEFYSEANFVTIVFQDIYIIWDMFRRKDDTLCSPNMFVPIVQFRPHFQEGT